MNKLFNKGDILRMVDANTGFTVRNGELVTVDVGCDSDQEWVRVIRESDGFEQCYMAHRFELVKAAKPAAKPAPAMILSTDAADRKATPITSGVIDYFPRALAEVARLSKAGNDQHNPGQPLHWDKSKSTDHADCISRHLIDRHARDNDGQRHAAKLAWRALALLETMLEAEARDANKA